VIEDFNESHRNYIGATLFIDNESHTLPTIVLVFPLA